MSTSLTPFPQFGGTLPPATTGLMPIQGPNPYPLNQPTRSQETGPLEAISVEKLDRQHPWYQENKDLWHMLRLMYDGGQRFRLQCALFLQRKPKELPEITEARMAKVTYQNILGSGVDWYLASMFASEPDIDFQANSKQGKLTPLSPDDDRREYYDRFRDNCDRRKTRLVNFFRDQFRQMLLYGRSWFLIDLPKPDHQPLNLAEQLENGWLDPYLVNYPADQVINWDEDDLGRLTWVIFKTIQKRAPDPLEPSDMVERWHYYDRKVFRVYERITKGKNDPNDLASLVEFGLHAMADLEEVPVKRLEVPHGLWMANKVFPQCLEHFNVDNGYSWALFQGNYAVPVIIGDMKETPTLSAHGYLKIPGDCKIEWTAPPDQVYSRNEERLASLREEIYRQMYLQAQGRSSAATPAAQSGYSKELDMAPSGDVANLFGEVIRAGMQETLDTVAEIRGDQLKSDVRGYQYVEQPVMIEIQNAQLFQALNIPSPTAEKENDKKVIRARFYAVNPALMEKMCTEVDEADTREERQAQQQQDAQDQYTEQMKQAAEIKQSVAANGSGNGNGSKGD